MLLCLCMILCDVYYFGVCVYFTYMYIYQIRVCISAKPPSENEERKFKKYYKRVRVNIKYIFG